MTKGKERKKLIKKSKKNLGHYDFEKGEIFYGYKKVLKSYVGIVLAFKRAWRVKIIIISKFIKGMNQWSLKLHLFLHFVQTFRL